MNSRRLRFALYGFLFPFIAGSWLALAMAIGGLPITEEGIRLFGAFATVFAPICAAFGYMFSI